MAIQPHFMGSMTLKALLEDPNLKNPPLFTQSQDPLKVKEEGKGSEYSHINYGSAFLGPNLWGNEFDNVDFSLEYMNLDEFLCENGVSTESEDPIKDTTMAPTKEEETPVVNTSGMVSPSEFLTIPPCSPPQFMKPAAPVSPSQYTPAPVSRKESPPVSPLSVEFHVSDRDLALSSIPDYGDGYQPKWQGWTNSASTEGSRGETGIDGFDPRKRNFSEEELKPQPIIKKSKKIFVPEDLKDDRYWARRHKNNYAAKRSRDARRVKENQIALRASFLEKENSCLKEEMVKLQKENAKLKSKVEKYESSSAL